MTNSKRKRSPWRLFFQVMKPYWGHLILAALFVLLAAICVYLAPFVTSFTLDYVIRGEQQLADGYDVILEIDVQGAMKVKQAFPDAVLMFITAPSMSEIKSRLIGRGTETMEQVEKRFATAFEEIKMIPQYDYVIINDVVDVAVHHMEAILEAERCRTSRSNYLSESIEDTGR